MSFKARELMIDVFPAARPRPFQPGAPGFGLCGEATRDPGEDDEVDCGEATRPPSPGHHPEADLAALRQQLRHALSVQP